jgi:integrase/recombinase XerD
MATARVILDKRKAKLDGTYPIKIRVAHVKDFERISTSVSLSESDFQKMMSGKHLNETLKNYKAKFDALIVKANGIIDSLDPFDFETFKTRFMQKGSRNDLIFLLNDKAQNFAQEEKYSSENLYKQTAAFLVSFINRSRSAKADPISILPLNQVTPKLLQEIEKWAIKVTYEKKTKGGPVTVGISGKMASDSAFKLTPHFTLN